ncbi:MAG: hypothetical protein HKN03_18260 [Acidimicrobiales bacterium]|nr:hypothetical protein [Acidimicrobiales bacterium]
MAAAIGTGVDPKATSEASVLTELDNLADRWSGAEDATSGTVMEFVYGELGFAPNTNDYYALDNSLFHRVLQARRANPISLAIIGIEIGRRLGVDLVPVGMPGHFLIGERVTPDGDPMRWFDPFAAGKELLVADAKRIFEAITPPESEFSALMLGATPPAFVANRILANIRNAAVRAGDISSFALASELKLGIPGAGVEEFRELARVVASSGRHDRAVTVFNWLAQNDLTEAHEHLAQAQFHLAHLN